MDKMIYDDFRKDLNALKNKVDKINDWIQRKDSIIKEKFVTVWNDNNFIYGCDPIKETGFSCIYKEGDWVIRIIDKDEPDHHAGRIFKVLKVDGSIIHECNGITHWESSIRLASIDEIKQHLINGAIEKGLVGYRKFKWDKSNGNEDITTILPNYGFEYIPDLDALTVGVVESESRRSIYRKGKWATPIFNKKRFPKDKLELQAFVYAYGAMKDGKSMKDLLDEYEDT
jgi:hypothetical protein